MQKTKEIAHTQPQVWIYVFRSPKFTPEASRKGAKDFMDPNVHWQNCVPHPLQIPVIAGYADDQWWASLVVRIWLFGLWRIITSARLQGIQPNRDVPFRTAEHSGGEELKSAAGQAWKACRKLGTTYDFNALSANTFPGSAIPSCGARVRMASARAFGAKCP